MAGMHNAQRCKKGAADERRDRERVIAERDEHIVIFEYQVADVA